MSPSLLLATLALSAQLATAQVPDSTTLTPDSTTAVLLAKPKVELAKLYLAEVQRVTKVINLLPFDTVQADVPKVRYTDAKFTAVTRKVEAYNATLAEQFLVIIPYADKAAIVREIIYLRGIK